MDRDITAQFVSLELQLRRVLFLNALLSTLLFFNPILFQSPLMQLLSPFLLHLPAFTPAQRHSRQTERSIASPDSLATGCLLRLQLVPHGEPAATAVPPLLSAPPTTKPRSGRGAALRLRPTLLRLQCC